MKPLVDMNLSPRWVQFLATKGIDALHWSPVGDARATDETIMRWAIDRGYAVFTHDLDFSAILATAGASGPSVLQVRAQNVLPEAIGRTSYAFSSITLQPSTPVRSSHSTSWVHASGCCRSGADCLAPESRRLREIGERAPEPGERDSLLVETERVG
jgi:predicted nuclease of predicted toxin-antitoxin system